MTTPTETNSDPTPETSITPEVKVTPADVTRLTTAVADAEQGILKANAEMERLFTTKDIAAVLKQADVVKAAERDLAKAKTALERGTWDLRKDERMNASIELKAAAEKFVTGLKLPKFIELGLRGFSVTFNKDDGSFNVNIGEPAQKAAPRARSESTSSGESKPRSLWTFNGTAYSSRELLEQFGGEAGEKAIDRATNWQQPKWGPNGDQPMASGPGFDTAVKTLARKMGWNGGDERELTHNPE